MIVLPHECAVEAALPAHDNVEIGRACTSKSCAPRC